MNGFLKSKVLNEFIFGFVFGLLYSFLFPLLGPRYAYFLSFLSFLHSIYFGLLGGFLFAFGLWLADTYENHLLWCIPALIISSHLTVWLILFSGFSTFKPSVQISGSLAISLFLFGTVMLRGLYLAQTSKNSRLPVFPVLVVSSLLAIKLIGFGYIPQNAIDYWVKKDVPSRSSGSEMKRVFYPLSIPFEQLVSTYNPLIPAVPDGKKIVTVIFDAFREDYFGRTKNGIRLTPNMTSFAEDNSYFSNYYVQSNWTKPSVASFFTGQYVHEHVTVSGAGRQVLDRTGKTTIAEHSGHVLPERYSTLAERLRKQDFQNAAYVSIPHISKNYNFNQGFNYYGYRNLQSTPGNLFAVRSLLFWTVRNQPENLFLYLHLPGPHFGYEEGLYHNDSFWKKTDFETSMDMQQQWTLEKLPPELVEKSLDETLINQHQTEKSILELSYASDVNYYDKVIFPLITKSLKNIGMFQNSLFVLTSDHGELLWDHQGYYGHSQFLYEELINVPLLVKLPEGVQLKTAAAPPSQKPMLESLDLTATILNYAGASRKKIEGDPFYSFSRSNPVTHKKFSTAYAEEADGDQLIQATVIRPPWKYKYNYQHEEGKLFNLATSGESKQITDQGAVLNSLKNNLLNEFNPGGQFQNPPPDLKTYSGGELEQLRGMGYIN